MEKLRVSDACIGCGLCVAQNEKYFEFNDEGFSRVKQEDVEEADKADLLDLIEACPGEAITIEDEK
ncbi:MAG: ferredoxin [Bacilli bacterium]|nr:ferredoxin [Bacilli bacterium]